MPRLSACLLPIVLLVASLSASAQAIGVVPATPSSNASPGAGISHILAQARAARLSGLHYTLGFTLAAKAATTAATETLTFNDSGQGDLPIDFRDGNLLSTTLNGREISNFTIDGHLILPASALVRGTNTLVTSFTANIGSSGKAITRYVDKDDGNEYLYTLFVPMDAEMAFPCFDQPDLKATFTLSVTAPNTWTVIANSSGTDALKKESSRLDGPAFHTFPETKPISTYLFAFAAGPFARVAPAHAGEPAIYVRQSQAAKATVEAPEVQAMTASGVAWLSDYFAQPFPFPKYDLVLIPGFPFGGMEHAGATFLNEDGVLFRSTPTASDYFKRDILVLHETTHQWFGDLVTMRWFDDLWLKEGFAQYMAYKAMADLKPETNPWKHFNEDIKPLAYAIDETQGTTPIFQNIPNLKDAKSAYGAIVYQKAPAVLKQLNYWLGETNFRNGLYEYLKQHTYANATWSDLVAAFHQTSHKDVQAWADAWILRSGMPEVRASWSCSNDRIERFNLTQRDVLKRNLVWPISTEILLVSSAPASTRVLMGKTLRVDLNTAVAPVTSALGLPCPTLVMPNEGDQAYGRFLLDPNSLNDAGPFLDAGSNFLEFHDQNFAGQTGAEPLRRSMLWSGLWESVHVVESPAKNFVPLAIESLRTEPDESISRMQGARIAESLHKYLGPKSREALLPKAEQAVQNRMLHAPTLGLRIVNFRTFVSIAESRPALDELKRLLEDPNAQIPGLTLKPLDRWNIIAHLAQQGEPHTADIVSSELHEHQTGEDQKYAYAAQASIPDSKTKASYFADYQQTKVQEDWLTQSLRPFNSYNQQALTLPYLKQALDLLPEIKRDRKIFFLGAWLGAFLDGQSTPAAQAIVNQWLARPDIDPDLRLKVLENKDDLDRTILIRKTFPE